MPDRPFGLYPVAFGQSCLVDSDVCLAPKEQAIRHLGVRVSVMIRKTIQIWIVNKEICVRHKYCTAHKQHPECWLARMRIVLTLLLRFSLIVN